MSPSIFSNDYVGIQINEYGIYEKEELAMLFDFLEPIKGDFSKGTAFDIGANIGNHSVYFAKYFAHVVAFEPNPITAELLRINARGFDNIEVLELGVGDFAGEAYLDEVDTNLGDQK